MKEKAPHVWQIPVPFWGNAPNWNGDEPLANVKPDAGTVFCYLASKTGVIPIQSSHLPREDPKQHESMDDEAYKRHRVLHVLQTGESWYWEKYTVLLPTCCHPYLNRWYFPPKKEMPHSDFIQPQLYSLWIGFDLDQFQVAKTPDEFFQRLETAVSSGHFYMCDTYPIKIESVQQAIKLGKEGEKFRRVREVMYYGTEKAIPIQEAKEWGPRRGFWMEMFGYFGRLSPSWRGESLRQSEREAFGKDILPTRAARLHIRLLRQLVDMGEISIAGEGRKPVESFKKGVRIDASTSEEMYGEKFMPPADISITGMIFIFPAVTFGQHWFPKGKSGISIEKIIDCRPAHPTLLKKQ